jgi:hypothetical protein
MKYTAILAGLLVVGAAGAQTFDFSHTWDNTEATMAQRLFRDGIPSVFGTNKAFPGTSGGPGIRYITYSITNTLGTAARLDTTTNALDNATINSFTAVYSGTFDPTNLATNYLGDEGVSASTTSAFGSYGPIAAGATLTIVSMSVTSTPTNGYHIHAEFTPVPEPASMAALGLGALALIRRRRASK